MKDDSITKNDLKAFESRLEHHVEKMELRLAKDLNEKIYDTYLKLIPIVLTILGLQTGIIFFVVKGLVK